MKFELKTDNDPFQKYLYYLFLVFVIIAFIILITNVASKLGNISRSHEIEYKCKLLSIEKSKLHFMKLSRLLNLKSKQQIWEFCREVIKY